MKSLTHSVVTLIAFSMLILGSIARADDNVNAGASDNAVAPPVASQQSPEQRAARHAARQACIAQTPGANGPRHEWPKDVRKAVRACMTNAGFPHHGHHHHGSDSGNSES